MRRLLIGLPAILAAACAPASQPSSGAPLPAPTGRFVEIGGRRIHYRIEGAGPPAVALHGASGNLLDWLAGPGRVITRTNRVLMFDRPGLGHSDPPPPGREGIRAQAEAMRLAAAQLGFGRALVIGHSFGGSVALAWAVDAPATVAGLALLAAPSQVWPGGIGALYGLAANPLTGPVVSRVLPALASEDLVQSAVRRVFAPQTAPDGYIDRVAPELSLRPSTVRANAAQLTALKDGLRAIVPAYAGLRMPVEILHGTADGTVGIDIHSEPLARQVPQARFTRLRGIGHMPHHAAPAALSEALSRLNRRA